MLHLYDTVIRQRAPLVDGPYGNEARDWTAPAEAHYKAEVQPISSTEDVVNQNRTVTRWKVYLAPEADIVATDRVVWDGDTYEVEGDIERWKMRGALHHLKAVLLRVDQAV